MIQFNQPHLILYAILLLIVLYKIYKYISKPRPTTTTTITNDPTNPSNFDRNPKPTSVSLSLPKHLFNPNWYTRLQSSTYFTAKTNLPGLTNIPNQQFLPFNCHVCKRGRLTNTKLIRCGACKIQRYCTKEHQSEDWNHHRSTCQALTKTNQFAALFKSQIKTNNKQTYKKFIEAGSIYIHCSKQINTVQNDDGGNKNINAVQVWNRQAFCNVCYTSEQLIHSCNQCHGVAMCKTCFKLHGENGMQHSQEYCDNWKMMYAVQGVASELGQLLYISSSPGSTKSTQAVQAIQEKEIPMNWETYFKQNEIMTDNRYAPKMCMLSDGKFYTSVPWIS